MLESSEKMNDSTFADLLRRLRQNPDYRAAENRIAFQTAIAQEIIFARISKNWTQRELAARAGVSLKTLSDVEACLVNARLDTVNKIFGALFSAGG